MKTTVIDFDIMNDCLVDCSVDFDIMKKENKKKEIIEVEKKPLEKIPQSAVIEQKINF